MPEAIVSRTLSQCDCSGHLRVLDGGLVAARPSMKKPKRARGPKGK
jgi:hypothetical protein